MARNPGNHPHGDANNQRKTEGEDDIFIYRDCEIKYLTVHRSKGLEEDNVILIN